jgi:hypothetical protein
LGNGIQSARGKSRLRPDHLVKLGVLFLADALLWMGPSRWIGMDFLGFIALGAILSKLLARLPRSGGIALGLAGVLVGWRFFVHPRFHGSGSSIESWLGWISGGTPGFSYPLTPWLAYPLIGYCVGRAAARHRTAYESRRAAIAGGLILAAAAATGLSVLLQLRGAVFFRWGSVSFAFFIASLGALGFAAAAVILASRTRWAASLSMEAQQSFATVPLHYATLVALDGILGKATGLGAYAVRLAAALAASFLGAGGVAGASRALSGARGAASVAWWVVGIATAASLAYLAFIETTWWGTILLRSVPQLGLCLLLGLPLPSRNRPETGVTGPGAGGPRSG